MLASASTTRLFRASSGPATARPATRAARELPPLRAPAAARARRSLLTRSRAIPRNGDHGDDDEESEKANNNESGKENSTPTPPTPSTPPHPRRGRPSSRDTARALEALRGASSAANHKKIGAEYGEGFVQFRAGGAGALESLDVDALNERLSPSGALRLRRALVAPDEAHGVSYILFFFFCLLFFLWPTSLSRQRRKERRRLT